MGKWVAAEKTVMVERSWMRVEKIYGDGGREAQAVQATIGKQQCYSEFYEQWVWKERAWFNPIQKKRVEKKHENQQEVAFRCKGVPARVGRKKMLAHYWKSDSRQDIFSLHLLTFLHVYKS